MHELMFSFFYAGCMACSRQSSTSHIWPLAVLPLASYVVRAPPPPPVCPCGHVCVQVTIRYADNSIFNICTKLLYIFYGQLTLIDLYTRVDITKAMSSCSFTFGFIICFKRTAALHLVSDKSVLVYNGV